VGDIHDRKCLELFGDSKTHISTENLLGSPQEAMGFPWFLENPPIYPMGFFSKSQAGRGFFTYEISKSLGAEQHQGRRTGIFFR